MRKILSIFAAALVAIAVNAQTDFAVPYNCTADAGVISGDAPANKVYLQSETDPHYIGWSDVSKTYTAVVSWTVTATRACYVSVSLDLGPVISSNKHIFEVKILDAEKNELGAVEEGPAYTGDGFTEADQVKALNGKIMLPAAGTYTVELRNNRDFCKGSIKNVILTYAGAAPVTDFSTPYSCTADDALISGDAPANKVYLQSETDPHYIGWSDVSKSYTAVISWAFIATRGCYVNVTLDLGPAISSNKHIFDVELCDAAGNVLDTIAEGPDYTGDGFTESNQTKSLGNILIPEAGNYTLKLMNHRDFCKGSIKNVILTYAADAPAKPKTMYFNSGAWASEPGRFAIYCITGESWADLVVESNETNLYKVEIPGNVEQVVFCRMNPELPANEWASVWNQTEDLTIPEGKDLYTITGWGEGYGAKATGKWSKYGYVPVLENGYYLVGNFADVPAWGYEDLTAAKKFVVNPDNAEEYQLENVTLAAEDSIKVVYVENDEIQWYAPKDANYAVDANHAGVKTVYFRPSGNGGEGWWYGCIYVPVNSEDPTAIENTNAAVKAVKRIENGQMIIIKNGVKFNAIGTVVK